MPSTNLLPSLRLGAGRKSRSGRSGQRSRFPLPRVHPAGSRAASWCSDPVAVHVPTPALLLEPAGESGPCHSTSVSLPVRVTALQLLPQPSTSSVPEFPPRSPEAPTGREGEERRSPPGHCSSNLPLLFSPAADRECPKFYTLKPREETGSAPQLEIKQARILKNPWAGFSMNRKPKAGLGETSGSP